MDEQTIENKLPVLVERMHQFCHSKPQEDHRWPGNNAESIILKHKKNNSFPHHTWKTEGGWCTN